MKEQLTPDEKFILEHKEHSEMMYEIEQLKERVSSLTKENERLVQWKTEAEKSLVESGKAIGALTEQVEKLTDKEATELSQLREERKEMVEALRQFIKTVERTPQPPWSSSQNMAYDELQSLLSKFEP